MAETSTLSGRVALVTGCASGLGQAIAVGLAGAGADIIGVYNTHAPDGTRTEIGGLGRSFYGVCADLSDRAAAERICKEALGHTGRIDILVNNAGTIRRADFVDFTEADWDFVMDVNLRSMFQLSQGVARHMLARPAKAGEARGKIIQIASMLSFQGGIRVASYTAAKHGVLGLTRLMANELAPHGINVNAIAPGYMISDNTAALRADAKRNEAILARIPAGRWGEGSDLAGPAVFLASSASDYVHGAVLPVDGGWLSR